MSDEAYMGLALELAVKARGKTSPNPLVGAVVVREGQVVGTGYHRQAGGPHAEVFALQEAGPLAEGATLYTNLEPCSHQGRTPPCVEAIMAAGIARVVSAMEDPNPRVAGRGFARMEKAGIRVEKGLMEARARKVNEVFCKFITRGLPFVTLKAAATLDGKIATRTGMSRWITGEESRALVHRLRSCHDAVLTGLGTVLKDDPRLNVRLPEGGRHPLRVLVDSLGRVPPRAKILTPPEKALVAVTDQAPPERVAALRALGVKVLVLPEKAGRVDLKALLKELGRQNVTSLLAEGGGALNYSLLAAGLVDRMHLFLAPLLFGGREAPTCVDGEGIAYLSHAWRLEDLELERYGKDILLTGTVKGGFADVHGPG